MIRSLTIALAALFSCPLLLVMATADPVMADVKVGVPGGCRNYVAHVPDADVAYEPGKAADGRAVSPADVPPDSWAVIGDQVTFDLLLPLKDQAPLRPEGSVGEVTTDLETGEVLFNGRPVSRDQAANLQPVCDDQ